MQQFNEELFQGHICLKTKFSRSWIAQQMTIDITHLKDKISLLRQGVQAY